MWIVLLALRRPYTFVVMAVLIFAVGVLTAMRMPIDIFPEIDIPVVAVVWNYTGISPDEMEQRIVGGFERVLVSPSTTLATSKASRSTAWGVVKIFLQPGAKIEAATAQITASSQAVLRQMPTGTTPPLILRYSASNVPIVQISMAAKRSPNSSFSIWPQTVFAPGWRPSPARRSPTLTVANSAR